MNQTLWAASPESKNKSSWWRDGIRCHRLHCIHFRQTIFDLSNGSMSDTDLLHCSRAIQPHTFAGFEMRIVQCLLYVLEITEQLFIDFTKVSSLEMLIIEYHTTGTFLSSGIAGSSGINVHGFSRSDADGLGIFLFLSSLLSSLLVGTTFSFNTRHDWNSVIKSFIFDLMATFFYLFFFFIFGFCL